MSGVENEIIQSIENNLICHKTEIINQSDNDADNLYNNNDANKSDVIT